MDRKKNKMTVNKKRKKLRIDDLNFKRKKDEQAATLESSNKPLGTLKRISNYTKVSKIGQNKNVLKPVMLAVISALVIGSFFGVILLRMFVTMDGTSELSMNTNPAAVITDEPAEDNNEAASEQDSHSVELAPISAFVLQAGIFSEVENAEAAAVNYEKADIPAMIWERDDQFFLFAGIANSAENAAQTADELQTEDLELYSKEWKTTAGEVSLTASEETWLNSYLEWWELALSSSGEASSQLEQLTESIPEGTDQISPLYNKLADVNEINNKILLELMYIYESLRE